MIPHGISHPTDNVLLPTSYRADETRSGARFASAVHKVEDLEFPFENYRCIYRGVSSVYAFVEPWILNARAYRIPSHCRGMPSWNAAFQATKQVISNYYGTREAPPLRGVSPKYPVLVTRASVRNNCNPAFHGCAYIEFALAESGKRNGETRACVRVQARVVFGNWPVRAGHGNAMMPCVGRPNYGPGTLT